MSNKEYPVPASFIYSVTSACNLACRYCYERLHEFTPEPGHIAVAERLVDFAVERGKALRKQPSIHFFGGEPLLAWDVIVAAVERAKKHNMPIKFSMTSNITLLDDEKARYMKENNISVLASIDGIKEVHDLNRIDPVGKGSFDKVMQGVSLLKQYGVHWTIRGTVTPETVDRLYESWMFLDSLGAASAVILPAYEYDWNEEAQKHYEDQLTLIASWWIDNFRQGITKPFKQLTDRLRTMLGPESNHRPCGLGDRALGVLPNGEFVPCHRLTSEPARLPKEWHLGNVFDGVNLDHFKISTTWDPGKIRPQAGYNCKKCPLRWTCTSQCPSGNWQITGSRYIVPKPVCDLGLIEYRVAALVWGIMHNEPRFQNWVAGFVDYQFAKKVVQLKERKLQQRK